MSRAEDLREWAVRAGVPADSVDDAVKELELHLREEELPPDTPPSSAVAFRFFQSFRARLDPQPLAAPAPEPAPDSTPWRAPATSVEPVEPIASPAKQAPIEPPPDSCPNIEDGLSRWVKAMVVKAEARPDIWDADDAFGLAAAMAGVPNDRLPDALDALEAAMVASLTLTEVDRLTHESWPVVSFLRAMSRAFHEPPN